MVLVVVRGAVYALLASGLSLIYGVGQIINLAHTAFFMLAAFGMFHFMRNLGWEPIEAIVVTLAGITLVGFLVYRFLLDRIRQHYAALLITTIALAMILQELMNLSFGNLPKSVPPLIPGTTQILGIMVYNQQLLILGGTTAVFIMLWLLLSKTKLGIGIRATASDPEVASLMGISVSRTLTLTTGIGTALAGVAAILMAPIQGVIYYMWMPPLTMVLVIVVLGGLGSLKGSVVGAIIVALVEALVFVLMPARAYLSTVFALIVMVVVLVGRPQGLFGTLFEEERL